MFRRHDRPPYGFLAFVAALAVALWFGSCFPARASCVPDTVTWTPTPTIIWDPVPDADLAGYLVAWRTGGGPFDTSVTLPCLPIYDDDGTTVLGHYCPGTDLPIAFQRYTTLDLTDVEIVVFAYDTSGNISANPSNSLFVCLPHIWIKGEPYQ